MSMKYGFLSVLIFISSAVFCQNDDLRDNLKFYADVMVNSAEASSRNRAVIEFNSIFKTYIQHNNLFESDLGFIKWISVLEPDDKTFKLLSWQVELENFDFQYNGYIIYPDGSYIHLQENQYPSNQLDAMVLHAESWYGALYYNILKIDDNKYVIFGFNGDSKWENQKIADVLSFEGNKPIFGMEIFEDKNSNGTYINRLVLNYSSDATCNLNYNPGLKMVIHDHLLQRIGRLEGQGPVFLPDGTYEGYEFVDNKWKYREKIYDHIYDDAPRPKPILGEKKDLFGKN